MSIADELFHLRHKVETLEADRQRLSEQVADLAVQHANALDVDRVGIALQAAFGGWTIPVYGWDAQYVERAQSMVRLLREGVVPATVDAHGGLAHNHGPDEGLGMSCPEFRIDGRVVGACVYQAIS